VLCCAVLCCAVLCCAVLCCAVLCCAVLCCAVCGMVSLTIHVNVWYVRLRHSADVISGVHGALGIAAALYSREHDGQGRYVDIAMVDCNFSLLSHIVTRYTDNREHAPRGGGHWYLLRAMMSMCIRVDPSEAFNTPPNIVWVYS
jgi:crotonobetainyl-CoA:carnitine CoA-transferase CaiB-like acyl-CoA transferase